MTGEDRLRSELEALEGAVPTDPLPVAEAARARPWRRIGLVGGTVVAAVALTSVALGLGRPLGIGSRSTLPSPGGPTAHANPPAVAETRVGDFILTISSPKTMWTNEESIEVSAALTYVGFQPNMTIGQGIPPLGFTLQAASGEGPTLMGLQMQPCLQYDVSADEPLVEVYRKGVPFAADGRPVDAVPPFGHEFLNEPELRLPPGEWMFTAGTTFDERGCGDDYRLEVSIVLEVTENSSPTAQPVASPTQTPPACAAALASGILDVHEGREVLISPDFDAPVRIVWQFPVQYARSLYLMILNGDGNVIATEGDYLTLGGGFSANDTEFHACEIISSEPAASPVARVVCRDSDFDPIGNLVTRDELSRDLERIAVAVQDEVTYAGMYISDEKGPWSGLEAVLLTTSCDIESMIPQLDHPDRLRIELVERSFDDLRIIHSAIGRARSGLAEAGEEIVMFGLDTMANAVRVTYLKGTVPADIVEAGGVPPAFAAQFGTDGIVFEVIDQLPITLPVPGLPLPSASEILRFVD
jgi:hypothetical protein